MITADDLKASLREYCKRVPPNVNAGSYQLSVGYKKDVKEALALLGKPRATVADLSAAINKLHGYWS